MQNQYISWKPTSNQDNNAKHICNYSRCCAIFYLLRAKPPERWLCYGMPEAYRFVPQGHRKAAMQSRQARLSQARPTAHNSNQGRPRQSMPGPRSLGQAKQRQARKILPRLCHGQHYLQMCQPRPLMDPSLSWLPTCPDYFRCLRETLT